MTRNNMQHTFGIDSVKTLIGSGPHQTCFVKRLGKLVMLQKNGVEKGFGKLVVVIIYHSISSLQISF